MGEGKEQEGEITWPDVGYCQHPTVWDGGVTDACYLIIMEERKEGRKSKKERDRERGRKGENEEKWGETEQRKEKKK